MGQTGRMWLVKLIIVLAVAYAALVALLYATQTSVLFPVRMAEGFAPALPASARRLEVTAADGERLVGVHLPPRESAAAPADARPVILGFGGNAWNADAAALYLHDLYPDTDVVAFHYRGYRPSSGRPSMAALAADAPLIHDRVLAELGPRRVVAAGLSIGAAVAAQLAARRPLDGLILVTPFDTLENLARVHFAWAPVGLLLRHRISTVDALEGLTIPVAVIAAGSDTIVPAPRTAPVRRAAANLVYDRTIEGAGHNDLYESPAFRAAMREALMRIDQAGTGTDRPHCG